jgi:hypothetical protein
VLHWKPLIVDSGQPSRKDSIGTPKSSFSVMLCTLYIAPSLATVRYGDSYEGVRPPLYADTASRRLVYLPDVRVADSVQCWTALHHV